MRHLPLSVALIAGLLLSGGLRRHGHSQLQVRWSRLSEQNFRVDKWNVCRV